MAECLRSMGYWTIEKHEGCCLIRLRTRLTSAFVYEDRAIFQPNERKGVRALLGKIKCKMDEKKLNKLMHRRHL